VGVYLVDGEMGGRIILKWILRTWSGRGVGWIDLAQEGESGGMTHGIEALGYIKFGEFLDWMRNC
jgi:hypothetical protein